MLWASAVAVCLADEDRHWVKASFGLQMHPALNNPRFHLETIRERDLVIVTDARQDPRFENDPAVVQDNGVRFYAGAPITLSNGAKVGTLCVIDREPRKLTPLPVSSLALTLSPWQSASWMSCQWPCSNTTS